MADLGSVITAIVTPFDEQLRVDEDAFVSLMSHLAANGSDGFVVCGTTGEAATLSDEEHLGLIELAVRERPPAVSIIAGAGSNDTRHAVHLTERCCELGVDAVLSVTPYYNRPSRRGLLRHFGEVARASSLPVILYNIPQRTGTDMPNDLLAELAQIERIDYVKQANDANLAPVDGLRLYAGNDGTFARVLDMGEPGGILARATSSARRCGAWSTNPNTARRSTPRCATSTKHSSSPRARPARRPRSSCSAIASAGCACH
jgi:4-hydroxy-tetrahydrodipicolinate synthase